MSGISLSYDQRKSYFFTTEGRYFEIRAIFYKKMLGSDYGFSLYTIDYRRYYQLSNKRSVGWQLFSGYKTAEVPFQQMFQLGDFLRAFDSSRYIDRVITILRSEYRYFPWEGKLTRRIGLVCFAESGTVFAELEDWRWDKQRYLWEEVFTIK